MSDLAERHKAISLALLGIVVLVAAAVGGIWLRQGLLDGVTWTGGSLGAWLKPSRPENPALYWLTIAGHAIMTAFLFLAGMALLAWGAMGLL